MNNVRNLTRFSISTDSTDPLSGVVEIDAAGATVKFELNEDIAHRICTDLERFLTQAHQIEGGYRRRR